MGQWLSLLTDETRPRVAAARAVDVVRLQPWVDPAVTAVELWLERNGPGAVMTVLAYAEVPRLPDETRLWIKYRLGTVFGAALREWLDHGF
jgi:hypothetical protein